MNCVQNKATRKAMVKTIGRILSREVAAMCSDKFDSILRTKCKKSMMKFKFEAIIGELQDQAPTLLALLQTLLKTRTPRANYNSMIAMIAAMILKHRNAKCSLMHKMTSVIMYAGHSAKQVRFQSNLYICVRNEFVACIYLSRYTSVCRKWVCACHIAPPSGLWIIWENALTGK